MNTAEIIINIAEYIGANEPLKLEAISDVIQPYIKHYDALYRLWTDMSISDFRVRPFSYLATTESEDILIRLIEESDSRENSAITFHSGFGFEPAQVLRDYKNINVKYITQVLIDYGEQQEVVLLKPDEPVDVRSVVGFIDESGEPYFF